MRIDFKDATSNFFLVLHFQLTEAKKKGQGNLEVLHFWLTKQRKRGPVPRNNPT